MSSQNFSFEMARRRLIANLGDYYALPQSGVKGSGEAQQFAREFAQTRLTKSGLRGLESLAWSTDSVGDILDYIRMRVGRGTWSTGASLAVVLEKLPNDKTVEAFFQSHSDKADETQHRLLHLDLCREFIKHLVAHFEFEKSGVKND